MSEPTLFPLDPELLGPASASPHAAEQWRLAEVQVANWGTFDATIQRIPIARRGHLITGPSGSGKSSLLDAIAAVLTPDKWLRFNVAAQTAGTRADQRTLVSYIRGAWTRTTDSEADRVVSKFLRPKATWSGIVLRYEDGAGHEVSLGRLFFVKGSGTSAAEVSDLCICERTALDLEHLQAYVIKGLQMRTLKAEHPDAVVTSNGAHSRFYARLRSTFGIAHETALQLLHKTQSAKSLDSLDQLFRDHMLEPPRTFALADTAVAQFGDLKDAHDHVVEIRKQRDHLARLREVATRYDTAEATLASASRLTGSLVAFRKQRERSLLAGDVKRLSEELLGIEVAAQAAEETRRSCADELALAHRRTLDLGGADADNLKTRIASAREVLRATEERWEGLRRQLATAGMDEVPTTAEEFTALRSLISRTLGDSDSDSAADASGASGKAASGPTHDEHDRFSRARKAVAGLEADIAALTSSRSTVPAPLLGIRSALAADLGVEEHSLPFAAELLEVDEEHAAWTGAIERVLRPLALTVLVPAEHLEAVRTWVDEHRIAGRFVYEEVPETVDSPAPARSDASLVNRVTVSASPFAPWVSWVLTERYDVACVEDLSELDEHPRAVTRNGQIKTSRTRYEKDDRREIDDRSQWVLGDREAKLDALLAALESARAELAEAESVVTSAEASAAALHRRHGVLAGIRELSWSDLDRETARSEVDRLEAHLRELEDTDGDLQQALAAETRAQETVSAAEEKARDAGYRLRRANEDLAVLRTRASRLDADVEEGRLPVLDEELVAELEGRLAGLVAGPDPAAAPGTDGTDPGDASGAPGTDDGITRETLPELTQALSEELGADKERTQSAVHEAAREVTRLATEFATQWPAVAADLTNDVADRHGYLQLLAEIEANGLPDHEARFRELLQQRSRDLIGELVVEILGAPREIEDRVEPINHSLRRSKFDEDRYLRLKIRTRRSETVQTFLADLKSIAEAAPESSAEHSPADAAVPAGEDRMDTDLSSAEAKYATLAEIMRRLGSSEHVDRVWRQNCLDTRLHVSFLAEEIDEHGRAHATYDSGAAMSGGQQQKLVVFCLAAALRYQLAAPDETVTKYGTIILDEAFDKADTRYTRMALDVFREFGFHMVLATPQKLLQTIEPYVGAATSVENPSKQKSIAATMVWDAEAGPSAASHDVDAEPAAG